MKWLQALMAGRSGTAPKDGQPTRQPAADQVAPDCAIWNDIARALDAKPKGASK